MIYPETVKESARLARKAIDSMADAGIPQTPLNFTIWYEHLSGCNPALTKFLNRALKKGLAITAEKNREIFEQFCTTGNTDPSEWNSRIEAVAMEIFEALNSATTGTEKYGAALKDFSGSVSNTASPAEITGKIKKILSETTDMATRMANLQDNLQTARTELSDLRNKLQATQHEAMTDTLTELANRRCFDESLERLIEESRVEKEPLSLILADIDYFKKFNDSYGHQVGDQVLRLVAKSLVNGVKGQDVVARYGGEEFGLILPNTRIAGAIAVAENLRKTLARRKLARKGQGDSFAVITLSFGVTEYRRGDSMETFLSRADGLLYQAKNMGRNRVCGSLDAPPVRKAG